MGLNQDVLLRNREVDREKEVVDDKHRMRLHETEERLLKQEHEYENIIAKLKREIEIKDSLLEEYRGDK